MELTDAERVEFAELIKDSFDPELWLDEDLPMLRAARRQYEEEQQREQSSLPDDADVVDPDDECDDDFDGD